MPNGFTRAQLWSAPNQGQALERLAKYNSCDIGRMGALSRLSNTTSGRSQAIVKVVRKGGTQTVTQMRSQADYLRKEREEEGNEYGLGASHPLHGQVKRSDSYFGIELDKDETNRMLEQWHSIHAGTNDKTTHIVASMPIGTDPTVAAEIGRDWAFELFDSRAYGNRWDYYTVFHNDRPHPHMHVVVNRRGLEGDHDLLRVSKRSSLNYDELRYVLQRTAKEHGVELDASPKFARGEIGVKVTTEEIQRAAREGRTPREGIHSNTSMFMKSLDLFHYSEQLAEEATALRDDEPEVADALSMLSAQLYHGYPISNIADLLPQELEEYQTERINNLIDQRRDMWRQDLKDIDNNIALMERDSLERIQIERQTADLKHRLSPFVFAGDANQWQPFQQTEGLAYGTQALGLGTADMSDNPAHSSHDQLFKKEIAPDPQGRYQGLVSETFVDDVLARQKVETTLDQIAQRAEEYGLDGDKTKARYEGGLPVNEALADRWDEDAVYTIMEAAARNPEVRQNLELQGALTDDQVRERLTDLHINFRNEINVARTQLINMHATRVAIVADSDDYTAEPASIRTHEQRIKRLESVLSPEKLSEIREIPNLQEQINSTAPVNQRPALRRQLVIAKHAMRPIAPDAEDREHIIEIYDYSKNIVGKYEAEKDLSRQAEQEPEGSLSRIQMERIAATRRHFIKASIASDDLSQDYEFNEGDNRYLGLPHIEQDNELGQEIKQNLDINLRNYADILQVDGDKLIAKFSGNTPVNRTLADKWDEDYRDNQHLSALGIHDPEQMHEHIQSLLDEARESLSQNQPLNTHAIDHGWFNQADDEYLDSLIQDDLPAAATSPVLSDDPLIDEGMPYDELVDNMPPLEGMIEPSQTPAEQAPEETTNEQENDDLLNQLINLVQENVAETTIEQTITENLAETDQPINEDTINQLLGFDTDNPFLEEGSNNNIDTSIEPLNFQNDSASFYELGLNTQTGPNEQQNQLEINWENLTNQTFFAPSDGLPYLEQQNLSQEEMQQTNLITLDLLTELGWGLPEQEAQQEHTLQEADTPSLAPSTGAEENIPISEQEASLEEESIADSDDTAEISIFETADEWLFQPANQEAYRLQYQTLETELTDDQLDLIATLAFLQGHEHNELAAEKTTELNEIRQIIAPASADTARQNDYLMQIGQLVDRVRGFDEAEDLEKQINQSPEGTLERIKAQRDAAEIYHDYKDNLTPQEETSPYYFAKDESRYQGLLKNETEDLAAEQIKTRTFNSIKNKVFNDLDSNPSFQNLETIKTLFDGDTPVNTKTANEWDKHIFGEQPRTKQGEPKSLDEIHDALQKELGKGREDLNQLTQTRLNILTKAHTLPKDQPAQALFYAELNQELKQGFTGTQLTAIRALPIEPQAKIDENKADIKAARAVLGLVTPDLEQQKTLASYISHIGKKREEAQIYIHQTLGLDVRRFADGDEPPLHTYRQKEDILKTIFTPEQRETLEGVKNSNRPSQAARKILNFITADKSMQGQIVDYVQQVGEKTVELEKVTKTGQDLKKHLEDHPADQKAPLSVHQARFDMFKDILKPDQIDLAQRLYDTWKEDSIAHSAMVARSGEAIKDLHEALVPVTDKPEEQTKILKDMANTGNLLKGKQELSAIEENIPISIPLSPERILLEREYDQKKRLVGQMVILPKEENIPIPTIEGTRYKGLPPVKAVDQQGLKIHEETWQAIKNNVADPLGLDIESFKALFKDETPAEPARAEEWDGHFANVLANTSNTSINSTEQLYDMTQNFLETGRNKIALVTNAREKILEEAKAYNGETQKGYVDHKNLYNTIEQSLTPEQIKTVRQVPTLLERGTSQNDPRLKETHGILDLFLPGKHDQLTLAKYIDHVGATVRNQNGLLHQINADMQEAQGGDKGWEKPTPAQNNARGKRLLELAPYEQLAALEQAMKDEPESRPEPQKAQELLKYVSPDKDAQKRFSAYVKDVFETQHTINTASQSLLSTVQTNDNPLKMPFQDHADFHKKMAVLFTPSEQEQIPNLQNLHDNADKDNNSHVIAHIRTTLSRVTQDEAQQDKLANFAKTTATFMDVLDKNPFKNLPKQTESDPLKTKAMEEGLQKIVQIGQKESLDMGFIERSIKSDNNLYPNINNSWYEQTINNFEEIYNNKEKNNITNTLFNEEVEKLSKNIENISSSHSNLLKHATFLYNKRETKSDDYKTYLSNFKSSLTPEAVKEIEKLNDERVWNDPSRIREAEKGRQHLNAITKDPIAQNRILEVYMEVEDVLEHLEKTEHKHTEITKMDEGSPKRIKLERQEAEERATLSRKLADNSQQDFLKFAPGETRYLGMFDFNDEDGKKVKEETLKKLDAVAEKYNLEPDYLRLHFDGTAPANTNLADQWDKTLAQKIAQATNKNERETLQEIPELHKDVQEILERGRKEQFARYTLKLGITNDVAYEPQSDLPKDHLRYGASISLPSANDNNASDEQTTGHMNVAEESANANLEALKKLREQIAQIRFTTTQNAQTSSTHRLDTEDVAMEEDNKRSRDEFDGADTDTRSTKRQRGL